MKQANRRYMVPKTLNEIIADAKLGERCNFENLENRESIVDLTESARKVRVFLMHNRTRRKEKTSPVKVGYFSPR